MAGATISVSEAFGSNPTYTLAPTGGASGVSGGSTTTAINCAPCCSNVKFLEAIFGASGACPGAVDNSVPVTLYATFNLTATGSHNLADYCLPASATLEIIADDYYGTMATRFTSFSASCSAVSPPTTRLVPNQAKAFYFWKYGSTLYFYIKNESISSFQVCDCSSSTFAYLTKFGAMTATSTTCSPFSITFGTGSIYNSSNVVIGTWTVTFTL